MRQHTCAVTTEYTVTIITNAFDYLFLGLAGLCTLQDQVPLSLLSQWRTLRSSSVNIF